MKLAFSTLGCPEFGWSDVYSMAKDLGFQGIEVRGLGDELFDGKTKPFQQENLPKTLAQLKKIRMNISCISSGGSGASTRRHRKICCTAESASSPVFPDRERSFPKMERRSSSAVFIASCSR